MPVVNVAIKKLRPLDEKGYNIINEWNRESDAHKVLDHPNITRGLAAYSQHGDYHIILEWANGGSLRSFWKELPNPPLSKESIMDLLRQLRGLSDALAYMHSESGLSSRGGSGSRKSSAGSTAMPAVQVRDFQNAGHSQLLSSESAIDESEGNGPVPVDIVINLTQDDDNSDPRLDRKLSRSLTRLGDNWRHGDIKPDNILRFSDDDSSLGTLKLADLGRAKQRFFVTQDLSVKEIDHWRTRPYEAPDIWVSKGGDSMSRLYDCWAMGCVFFEAVIWMLYGVQANWHFEATNSKAQQEGTPYWTRDGDGAKVSVLASGWMDHILEHDPECNLKTGTVMGDLMRLVKEKLLQIRLPINRDEYTPGYRTTAEDLRQSLEAILERAGAEERGETNDGYIFTGSSRENVQPPSIDPHFARPQERRPSSDLLALPRGLRPDSLSVPKRPRGTTTTRRQNEYTHSLDDVWKYVDDDRFASSVMVRNQYPFTKLLSEVSSPICSSCQDIGRYFTGFTFERPMQDLRKSTKSCLLCSMLYKAAQGLEISGRAKVKLSTSPAGLKIYHQDKENLILRFCRSNGKFYS
jgi:serine/threonine protein kinase